MQGTNTTRVRGSQEKGSKSKALTLQKLGLVSVLMESGLKDQLSASLCSSEYWARLKVEFFYALFSQVQSKTLALPGVGSLSLIYLILHVRYSLQRLFMFQLG